MKMIHKQHTQIRTYLKIITEKIYQRRRHKYFTLLLQKIYFYSKEQY